MNPHKKSLLAGALALLAGCATPPPSGPGVLVLPGSSKNFDQFRVDDSECRQYASLQTGATPDQAATDSGIRSAAVGTAVGTVAGAAIGGNSAGAGVGAGVGLAVGALAGTGTAQASSYTLQQRYDFAYQQCMYAKGNKIPMARSAVAPRNTRSRSAYAPPPPPPPSTDSTRPAPPPGPPPAGVPPDYRPN